MVRADRDGICAARLIRPVQHGLQCRFQTGRLSCCKPRILEMHAWLTKLQTCCSEHGSGVVWLTVWAGGAEHVHPTCKFHSLPRADLHPKGFHFVCASNDFKPLGLTVKNAQKWNPDCIRMENQLTTPHSAQSSRNMGNPTHLAGCQLTSSSSL